MLLIKYEKAFLAFNWEMSLILAYALGVALIFLFK